MSPPVVATVGTTHPLAFAGLAFAALALADGGVRPVIVVTGVSAQSGISVLGRQPLDAAAIAQQFDAIRDSGVGAFHVGALLSADVVRSVAAGLATFPGIPVVVDPVLAASTGEPIGSGDVLAALRELLPIATLVTPNLDEAAALANLAVGAVHDEPTMGEAGEALVCAGAGAVLVKGGHLHGDAIDVLVAPTGTQTFRSERVAGTMRGTGDLLAVTIAAEVARGVSLAHAVERARARVADAIAGGVDFAGTRVAAVRADESAREANRPTS
jgi:hydroxymethylpyrimidine kinase/phosphomethylpyrimidine kinase